MIEQVEKEKKRRKEREKKREGIYKRPRERSKTHSCRTRACWYERKESKGDIKVKWNIEGTRNGETQEKEKKQGRKRAATRLAEGSKTTPVRGYGS